MFMAWVGGGAVLACPLLIPADHIAFRAIACVVCVYQWFKLVDLARVIRQPRVEPITFSQVVSFLVPFPLFLVVFDQKQHRTRRACVDPVEVLRVILGGSIVFAAMWLLRITANMEMLRASFVLDHLFVLILFVPTVEAISQLSLGLERLAGYQTTPIIRFAFLSRTVGEFWYRFNTRVHAWLHHNVFVPGGGTHAPVFGIALVFFVSASFHELMFGLATSRFDGYQFTFFMLQVPALLASRSIGGLRNRSRLAREVVGRVTTITWFAVSSILFFHGVDRVFPFVYTSTPWLP